MQTSSSPRSEADAYQQAADNVVATLATDVRTGLSTSEACSRLDRYGRNELGAQTPIPAWRKFLAQFRDPLVTLLLIATAISATLWWVERSESLPFEAIAILAVVVLNAVMGYVQQARAEQAVAALRQISVLLSLVLQVVVTYIPFLQQAFSTAALSFTDWLKCAAVGSSVLWLTEGIKLLARARRAHD